MLQAPCPFGGALGGFPKVSDLTKSYPGVGLQCVKTLTNLRYLIQVVEVALGEPIENYALHRAS